MSISAGLELELLPTKLRCHASFFGHSEDAISHIIVSLSPFLCTQETSRVVVSATSDGIRKGFVATERHITLSCILHNATEANTKHHNKLIA